MEQPPQLSELRRYFSDLQRSHLHPTSADDNTLITREDCEFRWRLLHNIAHIGRFSFDVIPSEADVLGFELLTDTQDMCIKIRSLIQLTFPDADF
jgi:hypothetical protein